MYIDFASTSICRLMWNFREDNLFLCVLEMKNDDFFLRVRETEFFKKLFKIVYNPIHSLAFFEFSHLINSTHKKNVLWR